MRIKIIVTVVATLFLISGCAHNYVQPEPPAPLGITKIDNIKSLEGTYVYQTKYQSYCSGTAFMYDLLDIHKVDTKYFSQPLLLRIKTTGDELMTFQLISKNDNKLLNEIFYRKRKDFTIKDGYVYIRTSSSFIDVQLSGTSAIEIKLTLIEKNLVSLEKKKINGAAFLIFPVSDESYYSCTLLNEKTVAMKKNDKNSILEKINGNTEKLIEKQYSYFTRQPYLHKSSQRHDNLPL